MSGYDAALALYEKEAGLDQKRYAIFFFQACGFDKMLKI